ncbi:HDOD domain-containing protein [uncultured Desulfobacter sp.]|uniref:HDOD domain-containing protein n=1 Tax=uncultured Desulfobacter sp. TaxID=240139 RepID=UPI0029F5565A|nr:HDOD domain-containing protein [uncultured Desulfobacter sp.]
MAYLIEIEDIIENAGSLLTLPDICMQIKRLVADPASSVDDLAGLISKDPALTARLLKIVNSPIYYFPRKISSVSEAIPLIGADQLYNLALATTAAAIIQTVGGSYIEMKTLWKKAVYSAIFAKSLSPNKSRDGENLFVAGLLSDIGALAIVKHAPAIALTAIGAPRKGQFPWQREKEVLGFTVAEVSGALLTSWNLSDEIAVPVGCQHAPDKGQHHVVSCCILHIATRLAAETIDKNQGQTLDYRKAIQKKPLAQLGMDHKDIDTKVSEVNEIAPDILNIFII